MKVVVEVFRLSRYNSPVRLVIRSPQALVCQSSSLTDHIREESSWHQSNCLDVIWPTFSATQLINKQTEVCERVWNAVGPVVVTSWSWFCSWEVPLSDVWNASSANTHRGTWLQVQRRYRWNFEVSFQVLMLSIYVAGVCGFLGFCYHCRLMMFLWSSSWSTRDLCMEVVLLPFFWCTIFSQTGIWYQCSTNTSPRQIRDNLRWDLNKGRQLWAASRTCCQLFSRVWTINNQEFDGMQTMFSCCTSWAPAQGPRKTWLWDCSRGRSSRCFYWNKFLLLLFLDFKLRTNVQK